jgi:general secretion pathway protein G
MLIHDSVGESTASRSPTMSARLRGRLSLLRRGLAGSNAPGFTLIELLVVIALIAILASMGVVQYRNSIQNTREAVLRTDLFRMRDAIDQYYADKTKYPASLDALVSDGYLRKIPEDPITKSADTWQTVPAEADPSNPSAEPGIYNVKSGATGTALDGSAYSDW